VPRGKKALLQAARVRVVVRRLRSHQRNVWQALMTSADEMYQRATAARPTYVVGLNNHGKLVVYNSIVLCITRASNRSGVVDDGQVVDGSRRG
jgi:hypothetical protein